MHSHYRPTAPEFTCVTSLAHHGLLGSVEGMNLIDVDLSSVPAEHLASLTSCVTGSAHICNVSGCDLVTILDSVKSDLWLSISRQSLGNEETEALVRAMESRVVRLDLDGELAKNMKVLIEYSGEGKCRIVGFNIDTIANSVGRNLEELNTWAMCRNWSMEIIRDRKRIAFMRM